MNCWFCGHELIWNNDFDYKDYDIDEEGILTILTCSNCNAYWEGYLPLNEEENDIGE